MHALVLTRARIPASKAPAPNARLRARACTSVAGPSYGQAATFAAACFLVITAGMYMIGGYRGETWVDPKSLGDDGKPKRGKGGVVGSDRNSRPPSRPPPRQRPSADQQLQWQNSSLAVDMSRTDSQGYLIGTPAPRTSAGPSAAGAGV